MLAALLLLGLLPLAVLPMAGDDTPDDDDDSSSSQSETETEQTVVGQSSMLEEAEFDEGPKFFDDEMPQILPSEEPVDAQEGVLHSLDSSAGETVIDGFEPGTDFVELDLTDVQGDVFFDMTSTSEGASVAFSVGQQTVTTVTFSGLSEVPADDIMLELQDETTGEPFEISLADAYASIENAGLDPMDPDAADTVVATDPIVATDPGLDPLDPNDPDPLDPTIDPDPGLERWSRNFGPVVKVDRMIREVIQNEETKEPFA